MRRYIAVLSLSFGLMILAVAPALAHHSFDAEYDSNKSATVTGIVTKVDWINPHAYIFINTKDDSGVTKELRVELGPPYALTRGGWKRDTVKIGDKITVENGAVAKDGRPWLGALQNTSLITAAGEKLVMR